MAYLSWYFTRNIKPRSQAIPVYTKQKVLMKKLSLTMGISLVLYAILLSGCVSNAKTGAMIAINIPRTSVTHDSVTVSVVGALQTTRLQTDIPIEDFQTALVESLSKSSIFNSVSIDGIASNRLIVRLVFLEQPEEGFNMTASLRTEWTLVRNSDGKELWKWPIYSTYTATFGEAAIGVKRIRLAIQGAARTNIEQGLAQLAELKLTP